MAEAGMRVLRLSTLSGLCLAASAVWQGNATLVNAAEPYAITASNFTMPMSGNGVSSYTVTGIPSTGTLAIACQYSGPTTSAKIPTCGGGPLMVNQVTAGETFKGTMEFFPYGVVVPLAERNAEGTGIALMTAAGVLLLGIRRGTARWFAVIVLGGAALTGFSACGAGSGMTAGTYQFKISANNEANPNTPLGQGVSTRITVTVP